MHTFSDFCETVHKKPLNARDIRRMATEIVLYWGSGSPPCMRVMIALEEKGLAYTDKLLSFDKKEHKSDEVLNLNPRGQLPTLRLGDLVIGESIASCEFLEAVYKKQGTQLLPDDHTQLALVLQRMHEAINVQKAVTEGIIYYVRRKKGDVQQDILESKYEVARDELKRWDGYLEKLGKGGYAAGKDFSMADVILFSQIAYCVRMGLRIEQYSHLAEYYARVKERPSIQKIWPPHWKNSDGMTMLADL